MKKLLLLAFTVIALTSCSKYKSNLSEMDKIVKKELDENAFAGNYTYDIVEYQTHKYDTINENDLLNILRQEVAVNYSQVSNMYNSLNQIVIDATNLYNTSGHYVDSYTASQFRQKLTDQTNELQNMGRMQKRLYSMDSTLHFKIAKTIFPKKVYRYNSIAKVKKIYVKEPVNTYDTVLMYFDEQLKEINLKDLL